MNQACQYEGGRIEQLHKSRFNAALSTLRYDSWASEGALRALRGRYAYVHVATHGFFLDPDQEDKPGAPADARKRKRVQWVRDAPELSGGLLLAGFRVRDGLIPDDDGLLTALEARTLELRGVRLVTLSSCQSGLGLRRSFSIVGFRSAFFSAGARNLVVSLWSVDDRQTSALMAEFYDMLWSAQEPSPAAALSEAMRERIAKLRDVSGFAHPYYWAPFVALGTD